MSAAARSALEEALLSLNGSTGKEAYHGLKALLKDPSLALTNSNDSVVLAYAAGSPQCVELFSWWDKVAKKGTDLATEHEGPFQIAVMEVLTLLLNSKSGEQLEMTKRYITKGILRQRFKSVHSFLASSLDNKFLQSILKLLTALTAQGPAVIRELASKIDFNGPHFLKLVDAFFRRKGEVVEPETRYGSTRHRCMQFCIGVLERGDVGVKKKVIFSRGLGQAFFKNLASDPYDMAVGFLNCIEENVLADRGIGRRAKTTFLYAQSTLLPGIIPMYSNPRLRDRGDAFLRTVLLHPELGIYPQIEPGSPTSKLDQDESKSSEITNARSACLFVLNSLNPVTDQLQESLVFDILARDFSLKERFAKSSVGRLNLDPRPSFMWMKSIRYLSKLLDSPNGDIEQVVRRFRENSDKETLSFSGDFSESIGSLLLESIFPSAPTLLKAFSKGLQHTSSLVISQILDLLCLILSKAQEVFRVAGASILPPAITAQIKQHMISTLQQRIPHITNILSLLSFSSKFVSSWTQQERDWIGLRCAKTLLWYSRVIPSCFAGAVDLAKVMAQLRLEDVGDEATLVLTRVSVLECVENVQLQPQRWRNAPSIMALFKTRAVAASYLTKVHGDLSPLDNIDKIIVAILVAIHSVEESAIWRTFFESIVKSTFCETSSSFLCDLILSLISTRSIDFTTTSQQLQASVEFDQSNGGKHIEIIIRAAEHLLDSGMDPKEIFGCIAFVKKCEMIDSGKTFLAYAGNVLGYYSGPIPRNANPYPLPRNPFKSPLQLAKHMLTSGGTNGIEAYEDSNAHFDLILLRAANELEPEEASALVHILARRIGTAVSAAINQAEFQIHYFFDLVEAVVCSHPSTINDFFVHQLFEAPMQLPSDLCTRICTLIELSTFETGFHPSKRESATKFLQGLLSQISLEAVIKKDKSTSSRKDFDELCTAIIRAKTFVGFLFAHGHTSASDSLIETLWLGSEVQKTLSVCLITARDGSTVATFEKLLSLVEKYEMQTVEKTLLVLLNHLVQNLDKHGAELSQLINSTHFCSALDSFSQFVSGRRIQVLAILGTLSEKIQLIGIRLVASVNMQEERFVSIRRIYLPFLRSLVASGWIERSKNISDEVKSNGFMTFSATVLRFLIKTWDELGEEDLKLTGFLLKNLDESQKIEILNTIISSFTVQPALQLSFLASFLEQCSFNSVSVQIVRAFDLVMSAKGDLSLDHVQIVETMFKKMDSSMHLDSFFRKFESELTGQPSEFDTRLLLLFIENAEHLKPKSIQDFVERYFQSETIHSVVRFCGQSKSSSAALYFMRAWAQLGRVKGSQVCKKSLFPYVLFLYKGTLSEVDCAIRELITIFESETPCLLRTMGYRIGDQALIDAKVKILNDDFSLKATVASALQHFQFVNEMDFKSSLGKNFPLFRSMTPSTCRPFCSIALDDMHHSTQRSKKDNQDKTTKAKEEKFTELDSDSGSEDEYDHDANEIRFGHESSGLEADNDYESSDSELGNTVSMVVDEGNEIAEKSPEGIKEKLLSEGRAKLESLEFSENSLDPSYWLQVLEEFFMLHGLLEDLPSDGRTNGKEEEDQEAAFVKASFPSRSLVENGAVSFCLWGLSSRCKDVRLRAGSCLQLYGQLASRDVGLQEHTQLLLLLRSVRGTMEQPGDPLPPLFASFASHSLQVLLRPSHALFKPLNGFLLSKPWLDCFQVPIFFSTFNSGKPEFKLIRGWISRVIRDGIHVFQDLQAIFRSHVPSTVLSFLLTRNVVDPYMENVTLEIIWKIALVGESGTKALLREGLLDWFVNYLKTCCQPSIYVESASLDLVFQILQNAAGFIGRSRSSIHVESLLFTNFLAQQIEPLVTNAAMFSRDEKIRVVHQILDTLLLFSGQRMEENEISSTGQELKLSISSLYNIHRTIEGFSENSVPDLEVKFLRVVLANISFSTFDDAQWAIVLNASLKIACNSGSRYGTSFLEWIYALASTNKSILKPLTQNQLYVVYFKSLPTNNLDIRPKLEHLVEMLRDGETKRVSTSTDVQRSLSEHVAHTPKRKKRSRSETGKSTAKPKRKRAKE